MSKKTLIIIVSAISALALILTAVLIITMTKPKDENQPDDPAQDQAGQEQDNEQTDTGTQGESSEPPKTEEPSKPAQKPAEDTNKPETDSGEKPTQGGSGTSSSKPLSSASKPKSYTEFSLTKGMSAAEAYEYLNNFLNSKYSILVNKQNKVGSGYAPSNLRTVSGSDYKLESTAASALEKMIKAAKSAGHTDLVFYSGYRTYASQKNKYETRTQKYINQGYSRAEAEKKAGEYIAPPGSSEHHTGLAADVCSSKIVNKYGALVDEFDQTSQWRWLSNHCYEYGFIIRYRKDAEAITGFSYEPWHFRFIGTDHARACTEIGITYEEYYSMIVSFRDAAKADASKPAETKPTETKPAETKPTVDTTPTDTSGEDVKADDVKGEDVKNEETDSGSTDTENTETENNKTEDENSGDGE